MIFIFQKFILKHKISFIRLIGYLITFASFYYLINNVYSINFKPLKIGYIYNSFTFLPILTFLYLILFSIGSICWELILEFISKKSISTTQLFTVFAKSNITKYLPGTMIELVTRNYLANKMRLSHKCIAASSFLEISISIGMFIFMFLIIFFSGLISIPQEFINKINNNNNIYIMKIIVMIFFIISLIIMKKYSLYTFVRKYVSTNLIWLFCKLFILYIIIIIGTGSILALIFWLILKLQLSFKDITLIISAYTFSAFAGYIVPGAPAGLGIRESMLLLTLSPSFGTTNVIVGSLIHRIIATLTDVIALIIAILIEYQERKRKIVND